MFSLSSRWVHDGKRHRRNIRISGTPITDMADRSAKPTDVIVPYCPVGWKHLITNPSFFSSPQLTAPEVKERPYWRGFSATMR